MPTPSTPTCGRRWARRTRRRDAASVFRPYTVDAELMEHAGAGARFMHCLPAHRGEEVTADVLDGPTSVVWLQAANRMHAARALLARRCADGGGARDGDARKAPAPAPDRPAHRGAADLEPGPALELLASDGVVATQATVSRDLEELGAVKVRIPGGTTAYAIPEHAKERASPDDHLRRVMGEFVVEVGAQREPGRAAHAARLAPTSWLRRSTAPACPTCSARSPATTPVLVCSEGSRRRRRSPPSSPILAGSVVTKPRSERAEASGAGVLRRTRHLGRGQLDRRGVGRRGRRARGRRRPEAATTTWDMIRAACARGRARRRDRRRRPRGVRRRVLAARAPGQRALRGQVPARLGALAAGHRQAPRRAAREHARRRGRPRMHRARATTRCGSRSSSRALAPDLEVLAPSRVWGFTREDCIDLRGQARTSRSSATKEKPYSIDENLVGPSDRVRRDRGPVGRRRRESRTR